MNVERRINPDRHPAGRQPADLFRGESRDPFASFSCCGPVDPGLRRDDRLFRLRCSSERRRHRLGAWFLLIAATLLGAAPAHAVRPDEMLQDPALEARAREVGRELRCLVCRNQSIDDSDADLAHDLRVLVRERLKAGDTDEQVIAYIRSRYGDFVLLRPPFEIGTALLWGGPLLILLGGAFGIARFYRVRVGAAGAEAAPLSAEERRRLQAVLGEER
jgi:cytochrome c-type biogenesis protein CcmH